MRFTLAVLFSCFALSTPLRADDWRALAEHTVNFLESASWHPQEPLADEVADYALVCIGGFADELSGIMASAKTDLPDLVAEQKMARGYYHCRVGGIEAKQAKAREIAADLLQFIKRNPKAPIILLGHSMGAALALEVARLLPAETRVLLLTLDPVDPDIAKIRPDQVTWWGNAYIHNSQNKRDFLFEKAGRWGSCDSACVNYGFDGSRQDEHGRLFIHDYAHVLLLSCLGAEVQRASLFELLQQQVQKLLLTK